MRSNRNVYVRKAIGVALGAVAALLLTLPAGAQSSSKSTSQSSAGKGSGSGSGSGQKSATGVPGGIKGGVLFGGGDDPMGARDFTGLIDGVKGGIIGGLIGGIPGGAGQGWGKGIGVDGADWQELSENLKSLQVFADMDAANALKWQGQDSDSKDREKELKQREKERERERADRESELYNEASEALNEGKWEKVVDKCDQVAEMKGKKADAALYWKAWALNKLGKRADAQSTLATMMHDYPQSRWLNDAKVLDVEVKQSSGHPVSPESQSDCETKLYALNGLTQADPARAVPLLEKMLHSTDCVKLRSQAMFVLAQSGTPEARALITRLARGEDANPVLQQRAIQSLGTMGGTTGRQALADIYASSTDQDMKKYILQALMQSNDRERILAVAKTEKDPELRIYAIRMLGNMNAKDDIWQLYQTETSVDVKLQILQSMWQSGDMARVSELAMKEKDKSLRIAAINALGNMGSKAGTKNEETLLSIYASEADPDVRTRVINSLYRANDADALVALARKETDPTLKKTLVARLSTMHSKVATDYLVELLSK